MARARLDERPSPHVGLASGPTTALILIKRLLDSGGGTSFEEAVENEARVQHIAYTTSDMTEGIQAFLERREPQFNGVNAARYSICQASCPQRAHTGAKQGIPVWSDERQR